MATYEIAHIREQGQDIIVVVVKSNFKHMPSADQEAFCVSLTQCARSAGLAGTVVPVWEDGGGRLGFLAPQPWHPFFKSLTPIDLAASINKKLTCQ